MTKTMQPGVYFVDTEGILIDRGDDRVALILRARRLDLASTIGEAPGGAIEPSKLAATRKECIDQIDLLDGKMRELERTIGELRNAYLLLTEKKWAAK